MAVLARRATAILTGALRRLPVESTVILPANTCPVVPLAAQRAGHRVALADVDPVSLAIDASQALALLAGAPGGAAVIHVRPYGAAVPPDELFQAARALRDDVLLVDDRCLGLPEVDLPAHALADLTLWSTGPRKCLDLGEGGFAAATCTVDRRPGEAFDEPTWQRLDAESKQAVAEGRPWSTEVGRPWLDERDAAWPWEVYRARIAALLPPAVERRRRLDAIYRELLPAEICLPEEYQSWRFNVRVPEPDALIRRLQEAGLFAGRHYRSLGAAFGPAVFPHAERLHAEIVNLFNDGNYDDLRVERTASLVRSHWETSGSAR